MESKPRVVVLSTHEKDGREIVKGKLVLYFSCKDLMAVIGSYLCVALYRMHIIVTVSYVYFPGFKWL